MFLVLISPLCVVTRISYFMWHPRNLKPSIIKSKADNIIFQSSSSLCWITCFLHPRNHNFYSSDKQRWIPPGLTPDIVFIRNVEVNQNKKVSLLCLSQRTILKSPHPFRIHTFKNNEKEVLHRTSEIFHLVKVSHLSSGQL